MIRDDLSDRLVHLTKGEKAADRFMSIVRDRVLLGGTGQIRGDYRCVCFTEAPIAKLPMILAQPSGMSYAPLGVMLAKDTLFRAGGRPVIYQPASEFHILDESQRYRHKDYEPGNDKVPDFSWEREWRVHAERLPLDPDAVTLVVPNRLWSDYFFHQHAGYQAGLTMFDREGAEMCMHKCPWHFLVLGDLGIPVPFHEPPP